MTNPLVLPNDNCTSAFMIKGLRLVPKRGTLVLNEYAKIIDFIEEEDDAVSKAYMAALRQVMTEGKRFVQPDWAAIRTQALAAKTTA